MTDGLKKWFLFILIPVVSGLVVFLITRSYYMPEGQQDRELQGPVVPDALLNLDIREKDLLDLVAKEPDNKDLLNRLGDFYFENNRFEKAIEVYDRVLALSPEDIDTYNDKGLALHYSGMSDAAVETLKKGTQVMPGYQRIWLSLGFVLLSSGRNYDEAKDVLNRAVQIDPNSDVGIEAKRLLGFIK